MVSVICIFLITFFFFLIYIFQPLFPGESGVDQLVEIIKVFISISFSFISLSVFSCSPGNCRCIKSLAVKTSQ